MMGIGMGELLVIAGILVLLFGAKKVPELLSGMGKGIREFRAGVRGDDEKGGPDVGR